MGGAFQRLPQLAGALASAGHYHEMRAAEFAPDSAGHSARKQAEQKQEKPRIDDEQGQEGAAQVEAQREFEQDQGHRAVSALLERVTQDHARFAGVQPVIDAQPQAAEQPHADGEAQYQGLGGKDDVEDTLQVEQAARLIGGLECQGAEEDVGQTE